MSASRIAVAVAVGCGLLAILAAEPAGASARQAVFEEDARKARNWLASRLDRKLKHRIRIELMDHDLPVKDGERTVASTAPMSRVSGGWKMDFEAPYQGCGIRVSAFARDPQLGRRFRRGLLAHEVAHCFQFEVMGLRRVPRNMTSRDWLTEGSAEWASYVYVNDVWFNDRRWEQYASSPTRSLFRKARAAVGFYAHIAPARGQGPTELTVTAAAHRNRLGPAAANVFAFVAPDGALVRVHGDGYATLQLGAGTADIARAGEYSIDYCVKECICPDGSNLDRRLPVATGPAHFAHTGGERHATMEVRLLTVEEACGVTAHPCDWGFDVQAITAWIKAMIDDPNRPVEGITGERGLGGFPEDLGARGCYWISSFGDQVWIVEALDRARLRHHLTTLGRVAVGDEGWIDPFRGGTGYDVYFESATSTSSRRSGPPGPTPTRPWSSRPPSRRPHGLTHPRAAKRRRRAGGGQFGSNGEPLGLLSAR
jgi:hypothetical protein